MFRGLCVRSLRRNSHARLSFGVIPNASATRALTAWIVNRGLVGEIMKDDQAGCGDGEQNAVGGKSDGNGNTGDFGEFWHFTFSHPSGKWSRFRRS